MDNTSTSYIGIIDAWVLPFMNLYGLAGYTTGELSFDVTLPELANFSRHVDKKLHGYTAGGGTVLGGAYNNFFGLVDVTYVTSKMNIFNENIETSAVAPRIGYEHVLGPREVLLGIAAHFDLDGFAAGDWVVTGTPPGVALQTAGWIQRALALMNPDAETKVGAMAGFADDGGFLVPGDQVIVRAGFLGEKAVRVVEPR